MLWVMDAIVKFLYAVLLSAGAVVALVAAPPLGIMMLLFLHRFMGREAGRLSVRMAR